MPVLFIVFVVVCFGCFCFSHMDLVVVFTHPAHPDVVINIVNQFII